MTSQSSNRAVMRVEKTVVPVACYEIECNKKPYLYLDTSFRVTLTN